jgi:hypothetical protein
VNCNSDGYEETEHMRREIIKEGNGPVLEQGTWRIRTNQECGNYIKI